jgi:hypothetical protein
MERAATESKGEAAMRRKSMQLSLLVVIFFAGAVLFPAPAAGATTVQSATGSGQFEFTSDAGVTALRTFAFEASKSSDGTVTGQAQVKNRATGQTLHIQIDCLNVIGNVAVLSGTATSATGTGNSDGDAEIFGVEDNDSGASDRVTRAFGNSGLVCTDITAANIGEFTYLFNEVEGGNVQIHEHAGA